MVDTLLVGLVLLLLEGTLMMKRMRTGGGDGVVVVVVEGRWKRSLRSSLVIPELASI